MNKQKGQISIFFSTSVIVMITFMAFIINIGIFVKAKINLQNAVDAAAYAGASVQARQLTNIGYLNWSMRNVFKEWMFKYYVLGGLNLESVAGRALTNIPGCRPKSADKMDFTMGCYTRTSVGGEDQYNFPSTCIDFAETGSTGLCTRYLVPGLPRFNRQNVIGLDETTNAFIDSIVAEKSRDCSDRTSLNFLTANTWAYNVTQFNDESLSSLAADAPEIAINHMGAFPQAFELGLRIRNVEAEVNFPPQSGVCGLVSAGVNCRSSANDLVYSHQERTAKAYVSAFRNLGSQSDSELKNSFTLTELPPAASTLPGTTLNTLLIPASATAARNKYYVDLKLITANYAPFYTAFATSQGDIKVGGQTIDAEGQCAVTKMGLPVPGYPMHFVKNPDILTYYAVRGQAKWIGLFNPFTSATEGGITITAYAAAKPIGGRIGPQIFNVSDSSIIKSRGNRKSSPYISALNTASFVGLDGTINPGVYTPGKPVPINAGSGADQFWMTRAEDNIGGFIADGNQVFFGVPNMVYDYPTADISSNSDYYSETSLQIIGALGTGFDPKAGLYNKAMFNKLRSKLPNVGGVVRTEDINDALIMVSSPTIYEAHNFLIPTPEDVNKDFATDSFGVIDGGSIDNLTDNNNTPYQVWDAAIYGPLFYNNNPHALFKSQGDLAEVLKEYLLRQEPAILKYRSSMNLVAADIFINNRSGATDQNTGVAAARAISDLTDTEYQAGVAALKDAVPSCNSIAGKFVYFYSGNTDLVNVDPTCPTPLSELLFARWGNTNLRGDFAFKYSLPTDEAYRRQLFSAYRPGSMKNTREGRQSNPTRGRSSVKIRNSYSVKFVPLKSMTNGGNGAYAAGGKMLIYSEGSPKTGSSETNRTLFRNPLQLDNLGIDLGRIEH